jgi:hypothetical protein
MLRVAMEATVIICYDLLVYRVNILHLGEMEFHNLARMLRLELSRGIISRRGDTRKESGQNDNDVRKLFATQLRVHLPEREVFQAKAGWENETHVLLPTHFFSNPQPFKD